MALDGKALPLSPVPRPTPAPARRSPPSPSRTHAQTQTATTPAPAHRQTSTRAASRRAASVPAAPAGDLDRLAGYAGVLTELTLATVGAG
jgi:hypothetical protein